MQIRQVMPRATRLATAEDLERLPDDDHRYELVDGRIIRMSPVGYQHGLVVTRLIFLLMQHLQDAPDGDVMTEVGFKLASAPDTVRAPDIAFVRRERGAGAEHRGYYGGAPDLAIEVLSPDDTPSTMHRKVSDYLRAGARLVVVVDPRERTVTSHARDAAPVRLRSDHHRLDFGSVVPGFSCALGEMFGG